MTEIYSRGMRNPDVGLDFEDEESLTKQSMADECDINKIMKRYKDTGSMTHISNAMPTYGDFSNVADYQEALHQIEAADQAFMSYSAEVRARFNNNPAEMIAFTEDPANHDEGVQLGLYDPPPPTPRVHRPNPNDPAPADPPAPEDPETE